MNPVTITEAANKLNDLIDAALNGEEVIIIKGDLGTAEALHDRNCVKLTPTNYTKLRPKFGSAKGLIEMSEDFDEPLEDFQDYM